MIDPANNSDLTNFIARLAGHAGGWGALLLLGWKHYLEPVFKKRNGKFVDYKSLSETVDEIRMELNSSSKTIDDHAKESAAAAAIAAAAAAASVAAVQAQINIRFEGRLDTISQDVRELKTDIKSLLVKVV